MKPEAIDIFAAIAAAGGRVTVIGGDRLKLIAAEPLPSSLIERVRQLKAELLHALAEVPRTPHQTDELCNDDETVEREERAAIIEYDGGIGRDWAEALANLDPNYAPPNVTPLEWRSYVNGCGEIADHWAAHALEFGWCPKVVFGYDGRGPFPYMGRHSLPWQLGMGGYKLLGLGKDEAFVSNSGGQRVLCRVLGYSELVWKLRPLFL